MTVAMWAFHEDNFVLGAALVVIGMANVALVSLARIKRPQKLTLLPFAAIPFGFALQQVPPLCGVPDDSVADRCAPG